MRERRGKYCLVCGRHYGPHLSKCCSPASLVDTVEVGWLCKKVRYIDQHGNELFIKLNGKSRVEIRERAVSQQQEVPLFGCGFSWSAIQNACWGAIFGGGVVLVGWLFLLALERRSGTTWAELHQSLWMTVGIISLIGGAIVGFFSTHHKEYVRVCPRLLMGVSGGGIRLRCRICVVRA
jgi:hypothetical protein